MQQINNCMKKVSILIISAALVLGACNSKKKTTGKGPVMPPGGSSAPASIASKTKGTKKYAGLFTFYQDTTDGKMYALIKKSQLGKEFIYFSYTENGLVSTGHNKGSFRDNEIFSIRKSFNKIEFVKENTNFYFDPENNISKAAEANISKSILVSEKVIAEDSTAFLIDATGIFIGEALGQIKPNPIPGRFSLGGLSRDKSKVISIRSYPENNDVLVEYVYENPAPSVYGGPDVTDARSVSIVLQHSFIQVPDNDFKPRMDDPRVGYFSTQVTDQTSVSATPFRDMIHRWHLKKKDPSAAISEPVEPIVWWIENTTPKEFRATIKAAGESWNKAFEKAGFKNAIVVKEQPDDATWEAGDIRYNVLRWTSSPNPPFGGYGPSFVNPRTGQILGADIMLEYVFITNRIKQENLYGIRGEAMEPNLNFETEAHGCNLGSHLHNNTLFGTTALNVLGKADVDITKYIEESLYYLILHEMGHTLGLMHNMKASQLWSPAEINNATVTKQVGLTGSVMDYPASNIAADPAKQGQYFTASPGPYDMWVIEYGYSSSVEDAKAERDRLNKILARSTEPQLTFGNDADDMRAPGKAIDPRVMVNDLTNDAIAFSADRMTMDRNLMKKIKAKYSIEGQSYQELKYSFLVIWNDYATAAGVVSRYIGGVYVERGFEGQPGAKTPYTPVSLADQKRAMKVLEDYLFAPNAIQIPAELIPYLQTQRRGFNFFSSSEDPKIHDYVLNGQDQALAHLLHPYTMARMHDATLYGNQYGINMVLNDLTKAIFNADINGDVNSFRQNLQTRYVLRLFLAAGLGGINVWNSNSNAAALAQLNSIQKMLKASVTKGNADTRAHREYLLYLFETYKDKR